MNNLRYFFTFWPCADLGLGGANLWSFRLHLPRDVGIFARGHWWVWCLDVPWQRPRSHWLRLAVFTAMVGYRPSPKGTPICGYTILRTVSMSKSLLNWFGGWFQRLLVARVIRVHGIISVVAHCSLVFPKSPLQSTIMTIGWRMRGVELWKVVLWDVECEILNSEKWCCEILDCEILNCAVALWNGELWDVVLNLNCFWVSVTQKFCYFVTKFPLIIQRYV